MAREVYTITWCDVAENHTGMERIGNLSENGFDKSDMYYFEEFFASLGCKTELIALHEGGDEGEEWDCDEAFVLVARKGVDKLLGEGFVDLLYCEQKGIVYDNKAKMYGRVVQKRARHNLCFGETHSDADYDARKGTVYAFDEVPRLGEMREKLGTISDKTSNLVAEANHYYDVKVCGIGYHGDAERKKVLGVRLQGEAAAPSRDFSMPLNFVWCKNGKCISEVIPIDLYHGDIYIMSEKATGHDFKRRKIPTLRHATGEGRFEKLPG